MGSMLRYCRTVSVRALLVPALLALAWLVWGAGSAQASTDPSKAVVSESALDLGLSNAPSLHAAQVLRAGQDPAGSAAHHVAAAADAIVGRAAPAVSTVAATTEPVALPVPRVAAPAVATVTKTAGPAVSAVSPAAASVAATVNRTAAPAVSTVDHAVAAMDDAIASVTQRLLRLPLPAVKPPQLPNPDFPVATVRKTLAAVVSTVPRSPVADARRPVPGHPSGEVHPTRAAAVSATAEASSPAPASATLSGTATPAPAPSNLATVQNIDSPFKTLAQLKITASTRPPARAIQAPAQGLLHEHPATERLNIAATHGESGSSGSDSSGSHTADIAASWNELFPAASALAPGAAVIPPSGPAADPGSSPD
ncbi:hypothetical protein QFZ23_000440 [Arthrobacter globiformis]|uniref:hypothetical protein n=1 Tax=Arthrobacter globiformis TaxID=1665 RepID=UPI00277EB4D9|nr:hypothetical protein [Arthrobacter globiformis]MDQ1056539.1 hypothetical protein [Arthrobacter globiformis]